MVKSARGRMAVTKGQQVIALDQLIYHPWQANRTFCTEKAYQGYISAGCQTQCSYETVCAFPQTGLCFKTTAAVVRQKPAVGRGGIK